MSVTIVGAGAVGLTLAARLARGGVPVHVVSRRPEAARAIETALIAEDAATRDTFALAVGASTEIPDGARTILLCTRSQDVPIAARTIAVRAPAATVVTFQNDVDNEVVAAAWLRSVVGGVWRETCTRVSDHRVRFQHDRSARAILGRHPEGVDAECREIAATLEKGEIDVGLSQRIAEDKWLKLCTNLSSGPNALIRQRDHTEQAFVDVKLGLLREAEAALGAAGILARSCDGRDLSLPEQIAHHAGSLNRGTSHRAIPLYNQVWASLTRHLEPEATNYHRRIIDLARRHDLRAPFNELALARLEQASRQGLGPECFRAVDLLPDGTTSAS